MINRRWRCFLLIIGLFLTIVPACGKEKPPQPTLTLSPTSPTATFTATSVPASPTPLSPTATITPVPPTPTSVLATVPAIGAALTDVQFALDVEQSGELIYPATKFIYGVTRVYVRFAYQGMGEVREAKSYWYLDEKRVGAGKMTWDGGDEGTYVIWMEDPNGIARGEWRWELLADEEPAGSGAFSINGDPRYENPTWGLSFDPPVNWTTQTQEENYVTFSSPDQRSALALRVLTATVGLTETVGLTDAAAIELATFQVDYPDAEVLELQELTVAGERAVLQPVRYTDQENHDLQLYMVSLQHADIVYSLWMLGPVEEAEAVRALLSTTLRSIRFSP